MDAELGTDGPRVILVAVDGSTKSLRAGAYAAGLARRQGSRLLVGHVVHPPTMVLVPQAASAALEAAEEVVEQLRADVERGARWLGIDVEFRTAYGNPYGELVKMAEDVRAELVVLGASTAPGTGCWAPSARMLKAGRWPVTVVP